MTSLLPPWLGDLMVSMKSGFGMVPALCQCPERPRVGALEWSKLVREVGSVNSPEAGRGFTFQSVADIWVCLAVHRKGRILARAELILSRYIPAWLYQLLKY